MGQGSINMPAPGRSPIEGIMQALQAVHAYYGLDTEKAQQKLLNLKSESAERDADVQKKSADPLSPLSKVAQENYVAERAVQKKMGFLNNSPNDESQLLQTVRGGEGASGLSASDIAALKTNNDLNSYVKSKMSADAMAQAAGVRSMGFSGRNSKGVVDDYLKTVEPHVRVLEDINKLDQTLQTRDKNGNIVISPNQLGDVNATIARIYSPNHMTDSTMNKLEYESVPAVFAKALQKLTADPTDIGSRELVEHMVDQAHHIGNINSENASKRLDTLDEGMSALPDPAMQQSAQSISNSLRKRFSVKYPTIGKSGTWEGGAAPEFMGPKAETGGNLVDAARKELERRKAKTK